MSKIDIDTPVLDWLLTGMNSAIAPEDFLTQFAEKLKESGVPVNRIAFFIRSLHPTIMGRAFRWDEGKGIEVTQAGYEVIDQDIYLNSPIVRIYRGDETCIRRRLDDQCDLDEFPVLAELKEEGNTDYLIYGLPYLNGEMHAVSFTTMAPGGFSDRDFSLLKTCQLAISRVAEVYTMRRTASTLLDTYLGPGTGERVLQGQIKRGDGDRIQAVVCFCDLRRSSALAEELGMEKFLDALNDFYDCTAAPILEQNGEVLRFIGDAFLGIFPLDRFDSEEAACEAALTAARKGIATLRDRATDWRLQGKPLLEGGFGLHIGEVLYGNIGTAERLEFTVVGATANEAARLESQCKNLAEPILVSREFARKMQMEWRDMGAYNARNISRPMHLFAPG